MSIPFSARMRRAHKILTGGAESSRTSLLLPFFEKGGEIYMIISKRSDDIGHPNEWVFPGGGAENNESPILTALREAEEEIGLSPHNVDVIHDIQNPIDFYSKRGQEFESHLYVLSHVPASLRCSGEQTIDQLIESLEPNPREVSDITYVDIRPLFEAYQEFKKTGRTNEYISDYENNGIVFSAFKFHKNEDEKPISLAASSSEALIHYFDNFDDFKSLYNNVKLARFSSQSI